MTTLITSLTQDLRFAIRQLRKRLSFTVMAVATLALGIGAATAVFSLVDTILLHPLPFAQPDRILALQAIEAPRADAPGVTVAMGSNVSYPNFFDWRERTRTFQYLASWQGQSFTLTAPHATARRIDGLAVSSDFFRVLGVTPALGRDFLRSEEQAGTRSVVISHALWQSTLDSSPAAIGRTVQLSDETYTVVGVLPAGFTYPNAPDAGAFITSSLAMEGKNPSGKERGWGQLDVIGRLAPGLTIAQAAAEMQVIQHDLTKQYSAEDAHTVGVRLTPMLQDLTGDVRRPLNILFAAVGFLLLIACANVAGLLLTRTAQRRGELALRSALGATRAQIIRQLLIESLTLSTLGGLAGFALAALTLRLAPQFLPADLPRLNELSLNPRVAIFAFAASILTGLLFGVLPAWRSSRTNPALALRDASRSATAGRGQSRLQATLVVGETALSLMLLVGAGLLIRSFDKLLSVDPGFDATHLITFRVGMPPKRFKDDRLFRLTQQLQDRFAAIPGVQASTYAYPVPLTNGNIEISFNIDGQPTTPGNAPSARVGLGPPNFFSALRIPLLRGRFFSDSDNVTGSPVLIVNQAFATRYFPGQDAIGKHITSFLFAGDKPQSREIVGIVGNTTRATLAEAPTAEYFLPFAQIPIDSPTFALRVQGNPATYEQTIRTLVAQQDSTLPVYQVRTNLLARSTAQQRFQTILLSGFAIIALLLAAVGLYAVLSYMVTQRTLELGLRMALGASRSDVLSLILRRGLTLCVAGLVLGLAASAILAHYLTSLLFHTPALDTLTFLSTTAFMLLISLAACLIPSARAAQLEPMQALRAD
jgi:putative ABC transport system permease protein